MNDAELREAIVSAAYLEGDFVLRSGKRSRYYLDKFRFETRPDLLGALGDRIAAAVREHEPEAVRLAAPVLGAVPLAAAASLAGGCRSSWSATRRRPTAPRTGSRARSGGRARVPRRGHRDVGRRARRGDLGRPRGGPRRPNGRLCDRPGGGRSRRSRAPSRPFAAPFSGRRSPGGELRLSGARPGSPISSTRARWPTGTATRASSSPRPNGPGPTPPGPTAT